MTRIALLAAAALAWWTRDLWRMWWRDRGTPKYRTKSI